MFLKYPREVRWKISELLRDKGVCVVKRDDDNVKYFKVISDLSINEIQHKTEIYTSYGKCKILNMNNLWYLFIQPSLVIVNNLNEKRYRQGFCEFISEDTSKEELFLIYSNRIYSLRREYFDYRINNFNKYMEKYLNEISDKLKIVDAALYYDREICEYPYSYLTNENMDKIKNLSNLIDRLECISQNPVNVKNEKIQCG